MGKITRNNIASKNGLQNAGNATSDNEKERQKPNTWFF